VLHVLQIQRQEEVAAEDHRADDSRLDVGEGGGATAERAKGNDRIRREAPFDHDERDHGRRDVLRRGGRDGSAGAGGTSDLPDHADGLQVGRGVDGALVIELCRQLVDEAAVLSAGRVKPTNAASTEGARGSGGVSQKTASAPENALFTTAASPCEPSMMSRPFRTPAGISDGLRTITRSSSPLSSRLRSTWLPIWPAGVVMTIVDIS